MVLWRSIGVRRDAVRGTAPIETRRALSWLLLRDGIMPRSSPTLVSGSSGWAYTVGGAGFVTSRTGDGRNLFGNEGSVTVGTGGVGTTVPQAPGTGLSRIDIVWVRHQDVDATDASSEPIFGVSVGVAASDPAAPAIPTGALELGRNRMSSAATSTASSGNVISQTAPWTGLRGTPITVRDDAELSALPAASSLWPVYAWHAVRNRLLINHGLGVVDVTVGAASGREPITATELLASGGDLTGVITIPALPVPYRVVAVATGRCGGGASERHLAWYYDSVSGGSSAQDGAGSENHVHAPAGKRVSLSTSLLVDAPAGVPVTFRLKLSEASGSNAFSQGAVAWTRMPR